MLGVFGPEMAGERALVEVAFAAGGEGAAEGLAVFAFVFSMTGGLILLPCGGLW